MAIKEVQKAREVVKARALISTRQITHLDYLYLLELAWAVWEGETKVRMTMDKAGELIGCSPVSIIPVRKRLSEAGLIEVVKMYPTKNGNLHRLIFLESPQ